jgi:23S rRNA (pseudouridine1915-N3)-methyltransferase
MANVELIYFGKSKFPFIEEGVQTFAKRIKHYTKFEIKQITPKYKGNDAKSIMKVEEEALLKTLTNKDYLVLLDEGGNQYTSTKFANQLTKWRMQSPNLVFVIGGAYGFSSNIYAKCHSKLSLSEMTYSHQLIKVIFLEQLYRGFTIINGESYHNP